MIFIEEEKYRNFTGIYMIKNNINGKTYIGQTATSFYLRYSSHKRELLKNNHFNAKLQKAFNKYGKDAFEFSVVCICEEQSKIDEYEKFYIKQYDSINNGYNIMPGGKDLSGISFPKEVRKKMKASSPHRSPSKETVEAVRNYMKNRTVLPETRNKLAKINTGENSPVTKFSNEDVVDIKTMILNGEKFQDIAEKYNCSFGAISAISCERSWAHIHVDGWEEYVKIKKSKKRHILTEEEIAKARKLYDDIGNQSEVARIMGCCSSKISDLVNGKSFKNI